MTRGELRRKILELLVDRPALTTGEIAALFNVSKATAWNACHWLEEDGRLDRFRVPELSSGIMWALRRRAVDA
jgi:DeoR/GlpR family transcriptional regulator of sugar metabolism